MKPLILLSRRFRECSHADKFSLTTSFFLLSLAVGCFQGEQNQRDPSGLGPLSLNDQIQPKVQQPIRLKFMGSKKSVAVLDPDFCNTSSSKSIQIDFQTSFGDFPIKFTSNQNLESTFEIDGQFTPSNTPFPISKKDQVGICSAEEPISEFLISKESVDKISAMITLHVPICSLNFNQAKGWDCRFISPNGKNLEERLSTLHQNVIRGFKRHPYSLVRKITLSQQLASALSEPNKKDSMNHFCRLLQPALPEELTVALRSKRLKEKICNYETSALEAINFGLADSLLEVERLVELLSTSEKGTIGINIPQSPGSHSEMWVALDAESADLSQWRNTSTNESDIPCWHPLYQENTKLQTVAFYLHLLPIKQNSPCKLELNNESINAFASAYIMANITSELEFPIKNGRKKLLRLPQGNYQYTIRENVKNDTKVAPTKASTSQGHISWSKTNKYHSITKW